MTQAAHKRRGGRSEWRAGAGLFQAPARSVDGFARLGCGSYVPGGGLPGMLEPPEQRRAEHAQSARRPGASGIGNGRRGAYRNYSLVQTDGKEEKGLLRARTAPGPSGFIYCPYLKRLHFRSRHWRDFDDIERLKMGRVRSERGGNKAGGNYRLFPKGSTETYQITCIHRPGENTTSHVYHLDIPRDILRAWN